jgi:hypothetical protein
LERFVYKYSKTSPSEHLYLMNNLFIWTLRGTTGRFLLEMHLSFMNTPLFRIVNAFFSPYVQTDPSYMNVYDWLDRLHQWLSLSIQDRRERERIVWIIVCVAGWTR